jgi:hypothetical protein
MNRSRLLIASVGAASIGAAVLLLIAQSAVAVSLQTRTDYAAAVDRASAVYKGARAKCEPLTGHDKDVCVVGARAVEKRAKASAAANYKGTIKSQTDNRIASADADYMVAKVACDTKVGQEKDACVKQAQATQVQLVADAKANNTSVDARDNSREDIRDAQYKVALAKCDAMLGTENATCVTSARSASGK